MNAPSVSAPEPGRTGLAVKDEGRLAVMENFKCTSSITQTKFAVLTVSIIAVFIFQACTQKEVSRPVPVTLTRSHSCTVCGMITVDLSGAKAQIHYRNGKMDAFCCTLHMFSFYLQPDRPPDIAAVYVNDMANTESQKTEGRWIDAMTAFYVAGGDVMGPHGEALVPFAQLKDAEGYVKDHGGEVITFNDVTLAMLRPDAHMH